MICPNCHTPNSDDNFYCVNCGHKLCAGPKSSAKWGPVLLFALMLVAVGTSLAVWWATREHMQRRTVETGTAISQIEPVSDNQNQTSQSKASSLYRRTDIQLGTLVIEDITGTQMYRTIVPVTDSGWMPLPMSQTLGGYRWRVFLEGAGEFPIEGGVFRDYDTVGLWQISAQVPTPGPELMPWNDEMPVDWYGMNPKDMKKGVTFQTCENQGYFIRCDLPQGISGPGIFMQHNAVVGWTFETVTNGGFFWNGIAGANLTVRVRLDDYYRLTFAGSREEKWLQALAEGKKDDLQALKALVDAYRYPRKLTDNQLPPDLKPSRMLAALKILLTRLSEVDNAPDVVDWFDRQTLLEIDDTDLFIQIVDLTVQTYGHEYALNLIESVKEFLTMSSSDSIRVDRIHKDHYLSLLEELASRSDWVTAGHRLAVAREYFPDHPELILFEVRLLLAHGDWKEAGQLLSQYAYPQSLQNRVAELQAEIRRFKGIEGKIVIRFPPGSPKIHVQANLNGVLSQRFLVDTGASMVTIPLSTARKLGIPLDSGPVRKVYTAGSPVSAREVILDSVSIDRWTVYRLNALVLDIPERSNLGLLGLNYLNQFDMDMQSESGVLTLTPR